jgi:DNA-directed RNA polymerase subunit E'/Rpb7
MITQVVSLPPEQLGNIRQNMNQKLKKSIGTSSQDGIIIQVSDLTYIESLFISRVNGHAYFKVQYEMTRMKPQRGSVFTAHVTQIGKDGLFCDAHNIRIMVPAPTLINWHFNGQYFEHRTGALIKSGDYVRIRTLAVRFDNGYQAIAELIFPELPEIDEAQP